MFCGGPLHATGQELREKGVVVLLQEGVLAWLQYKNSPGSVVGTETGIYSGQPESSDLPEEELVILLATMIGGTLYEPEF